MPLRNVDPSTTRHALKVLAAGSDRAPERLCPACGYRAQARPGGMCAQCCRRRRSRRAEQLPVNGSSLMAEVVASCERKLAAAGAVTDADVCSMAAVGAVRELWRDGPLEDMHAETGVPSDAEMMRLNAATVRVVRPLISLSGTAWRAVVETIVDPHRRLPDGSSVEQLLGDRLAQVREHAWQRVHQWFEPIERQHGPRAGAAVAALPALHTRWHGTPGWPRYVDAFCAAVNDPASPHWATRSLADVGARPPDIASTAQLRQILVEGPDRLSAEAAAWCMRALISYVTVRADEG